MPSPRSAEPGRDVTVLEFGLRNQIPTQLHLASGGGCGRNRRSPRSTARRYEANFRAIASVARLWLPFCFCWSYSNANSGCQRGATFAASIRVVCKCLFRYFEIGVLCNLPAELCSAPHKPQ